MSEIVNESKKEESPIVNSILNLLQACDEEGLNVISKKVNDLKVKLNSSQSQSNDDKLLNFTNENLDYSTENVGAKLGNEIFRKQCESEYRNNNFTLTKVEEYYETNIALSEFRTVIVSSFKKQGFDVKSYADGTVRLYPQVDPKFKEKLISKYVESIKNKMLTSLK